MRWTLPNILTILRLLAAPGIPVMFLYFHRPWADWAALALFMLAAVTDWFDGYLARAWKQESRFGAAMDPIAERKAVMKNNGAAIGTLAKMAKGEAPFEAGAANLAVRVLYNGSAGFTALFPAGSETGGETEASPKIWEDMAGFKAKDVALEEAAAGVMATPIADLDGVKAALGAIGKNCQGCHETFRVKKDG